MSAGRNKDRDYHEKEKKEFVRDLEGHGAFSWMKDKRYKSMFKDIEDRIQGVLGKGKFEWVDRRVFDQVFDRLTLMSIYKLMTKGQIDTLDFPIARGKEAHVFRGQSLNGPVAVKIFHTSNAVFKNLSQYIEGDPRFGGLKRKHRDLVDVWVRKEYRNLLRLHKWNLSVPSPIDVQKNVLVMDYIGDEHAPSPRLRDAKITQPRAVYDAIVHFMAVAWHKADLVHGDLSPYNILWHNEKPVIIDVGQGVLQNHPKSQDFLIRDATQITKWAQKMGIDVEIADTMYDILEADLSQVEER